MADSKHLVDDSKRFHSKTEVEIERILLERTAKNTRRATKSNLKTFYNYLTEKGLPKLKDLGVLQLAEILENFYPSLRKVDGDDYKLQSIKCIRAGINRWTKENRNLDIIADVRFTKANEIFKGVSKIVREKGKGSTKSTAVIAQEDLERLAIFFLHDVMNHPDPRKIQKCMIFYIIYFFCHCGRENLYNMQPDQFEIGTDPDGRQYIFQAIDELDKNHGINSTDQANQGRVYERPGECLNKSKSI